MNCKPGDLAIMVDSRVTENIGVVFEVLGHDVEATAHYGHQCWRVRSSRPTRNSDGTMSIEGRAADFDLRPISGIPMDDEVTHDVKEPA